MKKTMVSLAAASLIATSAMAADKGIDIVTTGQAVIYYQTHADNGDADTSFFNQDDSSANVGLQLNLNADLKNNFTFGSQLSYLGTAGLEKNLVAGTRQGVTSNAGSTTDEIALTKIFVAKKIGKTTVKIGRQELPKSLSPLAYSEGWNVFKNTFDAILAVNSDIPDTTLVGAYVSGGTGMNLTNTGDLVVGGTPAQVTDGAYMFTAANKSIPLTAITASYYHMVHMEIDNGVGVDPTTLNGADALWLDVKVAGKELPLGLNFGLQAGTIMTDHDGLADTTAFGVKAFMKPMKALNVGLAFTSVDGDDNKINAAIKNTGTGIKTPLYTQMIANQNAIALDGSTFMLKAAYNFGDYGKLIGQGTMTTAGHSNLMGDENDYTDLELIYKIKAGGVQYLAAIVNQGWDKKNANNMDSNNFIRVWARYAF